MTGTANEATESRELIFLSHSGADTEAAKSLASLLRQGGIDVSLDVECLAPGAVWMDQLGELKRESHLSIFSLF